MMYIHIWYAPPLSVRPKSSERSENEIVSVVSIGQDLGNLLKKRRSRGPVAAPTSSVEFAKHAKQGEFRSFFVSFLAVCCFMMHGERR